MNKTYRVTFRTIDHEADDAGYCSPIEYTFIESPCKMTATMEFCNGMQDQRFEIISVEQE